jgi:hypothetical protein
VGVAVGDAGVAVGSSTGAETGAGAEVAATAVAQLETVRIAPAFSTATNPTTISEPVLNSKVHPT